MASHLWTEADNAALKELLDESPTTLIEYAHVHSDLLRLRHVIHNPVMLVDTETGKLTDRHEMLSLIEAKLDSLKDYRARDRHPETLYLPPLALREDVEDLLRDSREYHSRQCKIDRLRAMVNVLSYFDNVQYERDQVVKRLEQLDG